jgi:palmitoyl-protein thioesterase
MNKTKILVGLYMIMFTIADKALDDDKPEESGPPQILRYLHGINVTCKQEEELNTKLYPKFDFKCIETTSGHFISLTEQINMACEALMAEEEHLSQGFTLFGNSLGGLIARALVQTCPIGVHVRRLVTLAAPHNGIGVVPTLKPTNFINSLVLPICYFRIFRKFVSACEFVRHPKFMSWFYESGSLLADLNNELQINQQHRDRLKALDLFMTIQHANDTMVQPSITSIFGYFKDHQMTEVVDLEDTQLWKEDRLGLREMHDDGRFFRCTIPGEHETATYGQFYLLVYYLVDLSKGREIPNTSHMNDICKFRRNKYHT